ncbi:MAG: M20/M25/M40 family metallo-hydrolase, partial [Gammaproteobacteria bacterium]|nr:M20/M25/M40 family metallo-hydrolase [Gammaproteobacteria bacterium]
PHSGSGQIVLLGVPNSGKSAIVAALTNAKVNVADFPYATGAPVPGMVEFSLEVRDTEQRVLDELKGAFRRALSAIARRRDIMFEFSVLSEIEPVKCDVGLVKKLKEVADELKIPALQMASGAAHDTQIIASIARAAMVFVPSKEGRSHSAAEWTDIEHIEKGANVLLNTMLRIAGETSG